MNIILAFIINAIIGLYSLKKKKLSLDGVMGAIVVGLITWLASIQFYGILLVFFFTSSYATKMGKDLKEKICSTYNKEKVRNIYQVLCNGGIPTLIALIYLIFYDDGCVKKDKFQRSLNLIYVSYYAACNGDTWASELGVLSKENPYLITSMKQVPKGVNGAVSLLGLIVSSLGGLIIGYTASIIELYYCKSSNLIQFSLIGLFSGLFGSIVDSILGAIFQISIYDLKSCQIISKEEYLENKNKSFKIIGKDYLSNNMVNFYSALLTSFASVMIFN
jgi:uncharacterized protein (TIGR00297 family)